MQQIAPIRPQARPLTRDLAEWIAGFRHPHLPESARRAIRMALLDTLGVGLYGMDQPWTRMVLDWTRRGADPGWDRSGLATVWGEARPSLRPADAALVNAVAVHAFELDDYVAKLHPGAPVIPAAVALAERLGSSGAELETACAIGYEVMTRISHALDPSAARMRGWHLTGVVGPIGAAAAGAVLLGLDAERTAWAIGLGATQGSGLFAFTADGAMSKRLHPGRAAHAGVMAVELAAMGFTGPTSVLEVEDGGFLRAFSDVLHPEALLDGIGERWAFEDTNFKPYACCGSLHAYVDAAKEIRERLGGAPPAGRRIRAGLPKVVEVQCGYDYAPGSVLNAQMSARFSIAAALLEGEALPPQFADEKLGDPGILALAERLELPHDPALDGIYPAHYCGWVEVERADGGFERAYVHDPSGAPVNPNHDAVLMSKFHALTGDLVGERAATTLAEAVADLPATTVPALVAMLRRGV